MSSLFLFSCVSFFLLAVYYLVLVFGFALVRFLVVSDLSRSFKSTLLLFFFVFCVDYFASFFAAAVVVLSLVVMVVVLVLVFVLVLVLIFVLVLVLIFVLVSCSCSCSCSSRQSSTSLPGGNQVDGLPPAFSNDS